MIEKLKDILYEVSDILLAFLIILVMSTIITWKVTDSLAYTREKEAPVVVQKSSEPRITPSDDQISVTKPEEASDTSEEVNNDPQENTSPASEPTQTSPVVVIPATTPVPREASPLQINIPMGTTGSGIAKILKDHGLIEDTAKFIARVEELKLAAKLRSGTFSLKPGTSLDDVIYTITGTNR